MRVWLHIGLPKTATTTLQQDLFEPGDGRFWKYCGVLQIRDSRKQPPIHSELMSLIFAHESWEMHADKLRRGIANLHGERLPVLISEECVTIDGGIPWQEKLHRLAWTFREHDLCILVGVRDPAQGMQSLFVERYAAIKELHPTVDDFIARSNEAKIFLYDELFAVLDQEFPSDRIHLLQMEALGSAIWWEFWSQYFGIPSAERPPLGKRNVTAKGHRRAATDPVPLGQFLHNEVALRMSRALNRGSGFYRALRNIYMKLGVRRWSVSSINPRYVLPNRPAQQHPVLEQSAEALRERLANSGHPA